jgi:hypothetical protein
MSPRPSIAPPAPPHEVVAPLPAAPANRDRRTDQPERLNHRVDLDAPQPAPAAALVDDARQSPAEQLP